MNATLNENDILRFSELKSDMKSGFSEVRSAIESGNSAILRELQIGREGGHIPISVLKEILDANNSSYKEMIAANNINNRKMFNTLCGITTGLVIWATGMNIYQNENAKAMRILSTVQQAVPVAPPAPPQAQHQTIIIPEHE